MPNPTIEDTAYTVVGLNVLVADKAIGLFGEARIQVSDTLGPVGENVSDVVARAETVVRQAGEQIDGRMDVSTEINKARKQARKQVNSWRRSVDPVADRFESNLPADVADFLSAQRAVAWNIVGAAKPAAGKSSTAKPAAKKSTSTKSSAKKSASTKSSASKSSASNSTAK